MLLQPLPCIPRNNKIGLNHQTINQTDLRAGAVLYNIGVEGCPASEVGEHYYNFVRLVRGGYVEVTPEDAPTGENRIENGSKIVQIHELENASSFSVKLGWKIKSGDVVCKVFNQNYSMVS